MIGLVAFAASAAPTMFEAIRTGRATVVWGTLLAWLIGEGFTFIYVYVTNPDWILLTNYLANFLMLLVITYYKVYPSELIRKSGKADHTTAEEG